MAFAAIAINVFIACPSDAEKEKEAIIDEINAWNYSGIIIGNTRVILQAYSGRNAYPLNCKQGGQAVISNTILKKSDILVAVFNKKKGMPTNKYESGTIEEITLHIQNNKPSMVYLCHVENEKERNIDLRKYIKNVLSKSHLYYPLKKFENLRSIVVDHVNNLLQEMVLKSKFSLFDEQSNLIITNDIEKIVTPCIVTQINNREGYYKALTQVINRENKNRNKRKFNDTTWGVNPDERTKSEQKAYEKFLESREKFIKKGQYREIYSEEKIKSSQIEKGIKQSKKIACHNKKKVKIDNKMYYEYRVIKNKDIPMFVYVSIDKKDIFLGMMQRKGYSHKFLHLISDDVGDFFESWFNDCWLQADRVS